MHDWVKNDLCKLVHNEAALCKHLETLVSLKKLRSPRNKTHKVTIQWLEGFMKRNNYLTIPHIVRNQSHMSWGMIPGATNWIYASILKKLIKEMAR